MSKLIKIKLRNAIILKEQEIKKVLGRKNQFTHCLSISLFIIFLFSCSDRNKDNHIVTINIDDFVSKEIKLSDFGQHISYLQFSEYPVFGNVYHYEFSDEHLFLSTDAGLLKYDLNGNFLQEIGHRGEGPEDYLTAMMFTLDNENKRIYILSRPHLIAYSFDGNFLSKRELPENKVLTLHYINGKIILPHLIFSSPEEIPYLWTVIDTLVNTVKHKINETIRFNGDGMSFSRNFTTKLSDNKVLYWNHYLDTIFHITDDAAEVAYLWGDKSLRMTPERVINDDIDDCIFVRNILESDHFLFLQYRIKQQDHISYLDKESGTFYVQKGDRNVQNDLDGGIPFSFGQYHKIIDKEYLTQLVYPNELLEHIEIKDLKEEDNQVLIMIELK